MSSFFASEDENCFDFTNLPKTPSDGNLKASGILKEQNRTQTPSLFDLTTPITKETHNQTFDLITPVVKMPPLNQTIASPSSENFLRCVNSLTEQDNTTESTVTVETAEERNAREEKESVALAWEFERQEMEEMYRLQTQFMRENAGAMSEEDYNAMQQVINESNQYQQPTRVPGSRHADGEDDDDENDPDYNSDARSSQNGDDDEEEEEDDGNDSDDPDNWDYERLLEIGHVIGDVKTERWRLRAQNVIRSLTVIEYRDIVAQHSEHEKTTGLTAAATAEDIPSVSNKTPSSGRKRASPSAAHGPCNKKLCLTSRVLDQRCAVCMDPFEADDKLNLMPCQHYFHIPCTEGWLADHNSCPTCKDKISATPEK